MHFIQLGEKRIGNVSPLLREAKDTAIGDTMYDKERSCEYLFLAFGTDCFSPLFYTTFYNTEIVAGSLTVAVLVLD